MDVKDIGSMAADEASEMDRLGEHEWRHLEPAKAVCPKVLDDGAVSQTLPSAREVREPLDAHTLDLLVPRRSRNPGHEHHRVEGTA